MDHADQELLAGCFKGESRAQEAFVLRFSNLVYMTVQQVFKARQASFNIQDVEDLHNSIFVRLLERSCRRLRQYQGKNGCSLPSWIRMISVRTVIDDLRRSGDALSRPSRLRDIENLETLAENGTAAWQLLDRAEKRHQLEKALVMLLPRDRLFVRLHCLNGLGIKEVAGILRVSENNAYSIKHRAIQRLRAILNP
ncbi:MAG: RNA polymerase sigma factor [Desulfobacterales bacterium]